MSANDTQTSNSTPVTRWLYCVEYPQYSIQLKAAASWQRLRWLMLHIRLLCVNKLLTYLLNACAVQWLNFPLFNWMLGVAWWRHQATPTYTVSIMTWRVVNRRWMSHRIWTGFLYRVYRSGEWLWNLANGKSVKSCIAYLTKKICLALQLSLLCKLHQKSDRASPRQCTQSAPDFILIGSLLAL